MDPPVIEMESPCTATDFELQMVYRAIRDLNPKQTYMEIGSRSGGSLASFGTMFDVGSLLVALDLAKDTVAGEMNRETLRGTVGQLEGAGYEAVLISMNSTSPEAVEAVREALGDRLIDMLLIDASHEGFCVYQDVKNYVPFVRPGGLIAMHDVGPVQYLGKKQKRNIRACTIRNLHNCHAAWFDLAMSHKKKILIQEDVGYGLVWKNDD